MDEVNLLVTAISLATALLQFATAVMMYKAQREQNKRE